MVSLEEMLPIALTAILIAIGPFLIVSIYRARGNVTLWKAFLFGWGGWLLAFLLRTPLLGVPQLVLGNQIASDVNILFAIGLYASVLAGIFEEGVRFFILRRRESLVGRSSVLSFALGWGLGEAIILFVPAILSLPITTQVVPSFVEILGGAVERNLAILAHISFTLIVLSALSKGRRFLLLAVLSHFALNAATVSTLLLTGNALLTEAVLGVIVGVLLVTAYKIHVSS